MTFMTLYILRTHTTSFVTILIVLMLWTKTHSWRCCSSYLISARCSVIIHFDFFVRVFNRCCMWIYMFIFNKMMIYYCRMHWMNVLYNFFRTFMNNIILYGVNNFFNRLLTLIRLHMLFPMRYLSPLHQCFSPFQTFSLIAYARNNESV